MRTDYATPCAQEDFQRCSDLFPEAILLVGTDGELVAANQAARRQLAAQGIGAGATSLTALCSEPRQQVLDYLHACARMKSFVPGTLTFAANGAAMVFHAEGALFSPRTAEATLQVMLRLTPKQESLSRFRILNDKINELSREVDHRRRVELELLDAQRRKDEFLAMLGHELRNPLSPIKAALQLQALPGLDDDAYRRARDIMHRQVDHLTRLVDDLLDVSRISAGKITLNTELLEVAPLIQRAVELCEPMMRAKEQQLTIELPAQPLYVRGDLQRLTQVVGNVLNNAAKYTQRGGAIRVSAARQGAQIDITVDDNGMGIAPAFLPRIFDVFAQSDRTLARSEGGLGIGLTLVRSLVEQHGGSVTVSSAGLNQGSTFRIALPAASAPAAPAAVAAEAPAGGIAAKTILVVDDNSDASLILADLLRLLGHTVTVAMNGQDAIASALQTRPDVVFLDIGLPDISGYAVAQALRAQAHTASAVLVALTGYGQADDVDKARAAGFDHHLVKPADINKINALLAALR